MNQKLFTKDFTLVVIGQVISLLGNASVRFVLPLYLLNQTGSSALYGLVTACAFLPSILLSPVGGILADRVNKKNIMVCLDFLTALVILGFLLFVGKGNLILLLAGTLIVLYGIAGAYQPSVQASVPALVCQDHVMAANSVINTVSSFASLLGPVLGGVLYSVYGLEPVLLFCMICFLFSAVMEIFITIPFSKHRSEKGVWSSVKGDLKESLEFVKRKKPVIGKVLLIVCGINLFLSAMIIVGVPYLITEVLDFGMEQSSRFCGFAEGALAGGGLAGGICAGIWADRLKFRNAGRLLKACAACTFPMGISLFFISSPYLNYGIIMVCCFFMMVFSAMFTIQMMAVIQIETPVHLVGKVISVAITVSMCAQPLGNALYGILFEALKAHEYVAVLFSGVVSMGISVWSERVFRFSQFPESNGAGGSHV